MRYAIAEGLKTRASIFSTRRSTMRKASVLFLASILAVSAAMLAPGSARAGDERVVVHATTTYPYNHIALVGYDGDKDGDLGAAGSASLVGPYMLLTAGHCVWSRSKGQYNQSDIYIIPGAKRSSSLSGSVTPGTDIEAPYGYRKATRLRTNTKFQDASYEPHEDVDYGAIFISCPFPGLTVYMPLGFDYEPGHLKMSGYPVEDLPDASQTWNQWFDGGSRIQVWDRQIAYDIYSSGGASGAPVWRSGDNLVVAVNRSHSPDDWNPYPGLGCRLVSQNEDLISSWLDWTPGPSPCPVLIQPVPIGSVADAMALLENLRKDKGLAYVDPGALRLVDAQDSPVGPPKHSVHQFIGNQHFNWVEYPAPSSTTDPDGPRYLVLKKPVQAGLSARDAALLLTVSATWREERPATQEATRLPLEEGAKAIPMEVMKAAPGPAQDKTIDREGTPDGR